MSLLLHVFQFSKAFCDRKGGFLNYSTALQIHQTFTKSGIYCKAILQEKLLIPT